MGVIIGLNVDFQNVSDARWKSVYEETLELIDAYPFMDKVVDEETYNEIFMYVDRTRERYLSPWHPGKLGWYTIGDMRSFEHAESFILFRDPVFWTEGRGHGETGDVYFSLINWHHDSHPEVARIRTGAVSVFHDKTQGYDYHKYVLGICCLIEDRLKPHAVIDGDVTRAQIQDAVKWVNRHVKKSIALPDRCDYHALVTRIRKSLQSEAAQLDALFRLLLYPEGPDLGEFVRALFERQTVVQYWKTELKKAKPGTYGMNTALNRYLDMQFSMEALCDILVLDDEERFMDTRTFMSSILRTGILKRGNQDSTSSSLDEQELREIFSTKFGNKDLVNKVFAEYHDHSGEDEPRQTLTELFKKTAAEYSDAEGYDETTERYDIENAAQIIHWKEGDSLHPVVNENIRRLVAFSDGLLEELTRDSADSGPDQRINRLLTCNRYFFIRKETWDYVFERIQEDRIYCRVLSLLLVKADEITLSTMMRSIFNNLNFMKYYVLAE